MGSAGQFRTVHPLKTLQTQKRQFIPTCRFFYFPCREIV
jgi:hypothetical protein